ncbi:hypothetical protein, partial [Methylobacterium oxalidis]
SGPGPARGLGHTFSSQPSAQSRKSNWQSERQPSSLTIWFDRSVEHNVVEGFIYMAGRLLHAETYAPGAMDPVSIASFPMTPASLRRAKGAVEATLGARALA